MTLQEKQLLYLDGAFAAADDLAETRVLNPANGQAVATVADASPADARRAAAAAARAFPAWSGLAPKSRADVLVRAHRLMLERVDAIARLLTLENGKPYAEAQREVAFAAEYLTWFAEQARRLDGGLVATPSPARRAFVLRQPLGVVFAITPWNFPATMVTRKVAPALAAGCTVILKPAPETPLVALALAKVFHDAGLPPGVLSVLPTSRTPAVAEALMRERAVKKVAFTGSTAVGKLLMRQAADQVKRVAFELGGNAPFIVFEDADLERALDDAVAIKYLRVGGQSCICADRIFVHRAKLAAFVDGFVARVRKLCVGGGFTPGAQIGPLISARALERVDQLVKGAVRAGAEVVAGGQRLTGAAYDGGHFYAPTVLVNCADSMPVVSEEIFGPVAPILGFDSEDEVIARANDSTYGLAAYAYTRDVGRMFRLAERLECGLLGLNDGGGYTHEMPFGGVKESGLGREGGVSGIEAYLEEKAVVLGLPAEAASRA